MTTPTGWYDDPVGVDTGRALPGRTEPAAPTAEVPAGWYDDPALPGVRRYWDGASWGAREPAEGPLLVQTDPRPVVAVTGDDAAPAPTGPRTRAAARRQQRRRARVVAAVAGLVLVGGAGAVLLAHLRADALSGPPASSAEKAWSDAGRDYGSTALVHGVTTTDKVPDYCTAVYEQLRSSTTSSAMTGVADDRSRALFTDACATAASAVTR